MGSYLFAVASGVLYVLGFPGFEIWPLSFVALLPLLYVLDQRALSLRRALGVSFAFGATTQLLGFHWLVGTLRAFAALPTVLCVLTYVLICLLQAGQQAGFAMLVWRAKQNGRDPLLLAPFCFGAVELVYPLLFPNYFAASVHQVPVLAQSAELGGPILVSMLLVAVNAALSAALRPTLGSRRLRALGLAAGLLAVTWGYGALRMRQVLAAASSAPKLRVGIVQANMGTRQKREDRPEGRRRYLEQSRSLELSGAERPELLIWPETAVQYVLPADTKNVSQVLGPLTTPVLFGGLGHRLTNGRAQLWNSAFLTDAAAHVLGRSDKMHLIPFAEYVPLGDRVPRLYALLPNSGQFEAGERPVALPFRGKRIAALICYEDVLPGFVRQVVLATRPHLLVNLSNDAWFGHSVEPEIHLALSTLRAIEHRLYFVRASNSGPSVVIDPTGRVLARTRSFERATLQHEVALLAGGTPYTMLGDWPGVLGLLVAAYAAVRWRKG
ncbi:MAG: apolipoprotein N-acyltransferase [Polyangiales bacterium]